MGWKTTLTKRDYDTGRLLGKMTVDTEEIVRVLRAAIASTKNHLSLTKATPLDDLDRTVADNWTRIIHPRTVEDFKIERGCMEIRRTMRDHTDLFDSLCIYGLTYLFRLLDNGQILWNALTSITDWILECDPKTEEPILRFLKLVGNENAGVSVHHAESKF